MFENKEITKEKIKDIMYAVRNEFENEVDDIDNIIEMILRGDYKVV